MDHPFAPVVAQLKSLERKLNASTYQAVFGRSIDERQQGQSSAISARDQMDTVYSEAARAAGQVRETIHSSSAGSLLQAVAELIRAVDEHQKEVGIPGPEGINQRCTAMQSSI